MNDYVTMLNVQAMAVQTRVCAMIAANMQIQTENAAKATAQMEGGAKAEPKPLPYGETHFMEKAVELESIAEAINSHR